MISGAIALVGFTGCGVGLKAPQHLNESLAINAAWPVVSYETIPGWESEEEEFAGGPVEDFNELLFGDVMPEFYIEVSDLAYDALVADPYEWTHASFTYAGVTYENVGLRCKGENSFLPFEQKCSLKVDFNKWEDIEFMGLDELTLNNMSNDTSMMHERLAYQMYREFDVPAARATHALVYLNGEFYGLFAHVETVDIRLARQWFDDDSGTMYEVHDVDFKDYYIDGFSLEFGLDDRTDLIGTAAAIATYDGNDALADLADHMNMDSFVDYWAVCIIVGQYDSYPFGWPGDDTHVYDDPVSGVLVWLPHGVDETFYDPYRDPHVVNGVVAVTCLESPECTEQLHARAWDALDRSEEIGLLEHAQSVKAQVEPYVLMDTNKNYDSNSVYAEQDSMISFIANRRIDLEALIGPRP